LIDHSILHTNAEKTEFLKWYFLKKKFDLNSCVNGCKAEQNTPKTCSYIV